MLPTMTDFATQFAEQGVWEERGSGVRTRYLVTRELGTKTFLAGITVFDAGAAIPLHFHNCEESVTILRGRAQVRIGELTCEGRTSDAFWITAGIPHSFANAGGSRLRIHWTYGSAMATRTIVDTGRTTLVGPGADTYGPPTPVMGSDQLQSLTTIVSKGEDSQRDTLKD
jgi:putative monooxygenase